MDYKKMEQKFWEYKGKFLSNVMDKATFNENVKKLKFKDPEGNWWKINKEHGTWLMFDGDDWVSSIPKTGPDNNISQTAEISIKDTNITKDNLNTKSDTSSTLIVANKTIPNDNLSDTSYSKQNTLMENADNKDSASNYNKPNATLLEDDDISDKDLYERLNPIEDELEYENINPDELQGEMKVFEDYSLPPDMKPSQEIVQNKEFFDDEDIDSYLLTSKDKKEYFDDYDNFLKIEDDNHELLTKNPFETLDKEIIKNKNLKNNFTINPKIFGKMPTIPKDAAILKLKDIAKKVSSNINETTEKSTKATSSMGNSRTCSHCHNKILESDNFCPYCGKPIEIMPRDNKIKCVKCGYMNPEDNTFCEGCGNKLEK